MSSGFAKPLELSKDQWHVEPSSGIVTLTKETLQSVISKDPFEKWYIVDPEPVSRGQFATVYRCQHRVTGEELAAKFSYRLRLGTDCTASILHEIGICLMLRQTDRAVQLLEVYKTDTQFILVLEYAPGGDLQTFLDQDLVPYERDVISFLRQVLEGLVYIHDRNIVHLDIKPQNLVLMGEFPDCSLKLCDFEISRLLTPGHFLRDVLGTPDYVAPEILHYEPITTYTDMWSLGVLTHALLTGFLPFGGETDQEIFLEISKCELDFPEEFFEDISDLAIDFIRRLLVRDPKKRMTAKESLEHQWIKAEMKKEKPPSSFPTPFPVNHQFSALSIQSPTVSVATSSCNPADSLYTSITSSYGYSSTAPSTPTAVPSSCLMSALNEVISRPHDVLYRDTTSESTTPVPISPLSLTPNILTPLSSSPKDLGLPPIAPCTSAMKNTSITSSTCSLHRGGLRQSLETLRSLSKSREVLFERLQQSSKKKSLSRSRERLYDGRLTLSHSRDHLFGPLPRSLSCSHEALQTSGWSETNSNLYSSYSNVYASLFPVQSSLPLVAENNDASRLYKSLASIDRIDEDVSESPKNSPKTSVFDSRFSVNEEDYNFLISKYSTSFICSEVNRWQGNSRSADIRKRDGSRNKTHKHEPAHKRTAEKRQTPKTPRQGKVERTKKESQKKRKEKDKQKHIINRQISPGKVIPNQSRETAKPPEKRRGSVSHIEQRIQERHERQQEKLEKQNTKENDKNRKPLNKTGITHRRGSLDSHEKVKEKNLINADRKRHTTIPHHVTPTFPRRQKVKNVSISSDESPCSSLESVKEASLAKPHESSAHESLISPNTLGLFAEDASEKKLNNQMCEEKKVEQDEAYVSLEEPVDDGIFSRSESMDSSATVISDVTGLVTANATSTLETTMKNLDLGERTRCVSSSETKIMGSKGKEVTIREPSSGNKNLKQVSDKQNAPDHSVQQLKLDVPSQDEITEPLTVIREEDEYEAKNVSNGFVRSVSTSSDIGSMLSENSEDGSRAANNPCDPARDWVTRGRSLSIQVSPSAPFLPMKLSRSNSVHLDTPLTGKPRPWGDVCSGAVKRAFEMFRHKSNDLILLPRLQSRKCSDPTSDRNRDTASTSLPSSLASVSTAHHLRPNSSLPFLSKKEDVLKFDENCNTKERRPTENLPVGSCENIHQKLRASRPKTTLLRTEDYRARSTSQPS